MDLDDKEFNGSEYAPFIISDEYDGKPKKLFLTYCQLSCCLKGFYVPKNRLDKAKYCSVECSTENQKRVRNAKKADLPPIPKKEPKYRVGPRLPGSR
jgi:hypothetical protein